MSNYSDWNLPQTFPSREAGHLQYSGPFATWKHARKASVGYDSQVVLEKVKSAVEDVLQGHMGYERDGTTFAQPPERDTLREKLEHLLRPSDLVIDFGGGLGGLYVNNLKLFRSVGCRYLVVEQPSFCSAGSALAAAHSLPIQFFSSLDQLPAFKANVVVASGVLQYIKAWKGVARKLKMLKARHILLDRHPLIRGTTCIMVQENDGYYQEKVSYPTRIFNVDEFLRQFRGYKLSDTWPSDFDPPEYRGVHLVPVD